MIRFDSAASRLLRGACTAVLLGAAALLTGCASTAVIKVDNLEASAQTPVTDLRPASERGKVEIFSLMITSDQYGYARLAHDITDPTAARLFSHHLQAKYGANPVPPTKLHHFVVYQNLRSELKRGVLGGALLGPIGALVAQGTVPVGGEINHTQVNAEAFDALSGDNEYKRAMYAEGEQKEGVSALIVFIETESEGKRRFTRSVVPVKREKDDTKSPYQKAVEAAIAYHLSI